MELGRVGQKLADHKVGLGHSLPQQEELVVDHKDLVGRNLVDGRIGLCRHKERRLGAEVVEMP